MREQHEEQPDPYYQHDELLGEAPLRGTMAGIHLQLHLAQERYTERHEIFPLQHPRGTRTYVHAKPYILEPDIRLTVALSSVPEPGGAMGRIMESGLRNFRRRHIGNAQAWLYHQDRALVLWECFLEEHYRTGDDPARDPAHVALWQTMAPIYPIYRR